ncbi:hypothetical protein LUZ61_011712 [Rhynchospora tenuis]|uniref:Reverse transcriptase domain-containing protein n=1 Tax=Rhynchospora tenuis TaxID=198213 RepID=A0AAD6A1L1_9POAL|nr:hypothetical protein LUZ61_011712 [Rhynchospora tenuis]
MNERSTIATEYTHMQSFNDLIRDLNLFDVPLLNKTFTWTNKQPQPIMSRLDRVLLSTRWLSSFPVLNLEALPSIVSDHVPLRLHCKQPASTPKRLRLELFWFQHNEFHTIANETWAENTTQPAAQRFFSKNGVLQKNLNCWHKASFPHVNVHLTNAKTFISLFDSLEEHRNLTPLELRMRILLRERAFNLANILEQRWHQRARIQWLKCGDRNTKFFHATASAKMRKKAISNLLLDGESITDQGAILHAFTEFYTNLLGTSAQVHNCSLHNLYGDRPLLIQLDTPFTDLEIKHAVSNLANNKASGPDGLPNEFAKLKWDILKHDILEVFLDLFEGSLVLTGLNFAHITLLPKVSSANTLTSFRPISIINYMPKLISKVLANRLSNVIPDLISSNQTGFVRGRLIHENFLSAREIVAHLTKSKEPAFLLKLDFYKAFDTVNWSFLLNVLKTFGIPPKFLSWIHLLLTTATSAVLINNQVGPIFQHKQGLRQGDPLSPFLFIMVADVLTKMCEAAGTSIPFNISNKLRSPFHILQYADDTLIFSTVKGKAVQSLKLILTLFSLCSGLSLNLDKSTFIPFNLTDHQTTQINQVLRCAESPLPLSYLGLPLTSGRPPKEVYIQLLEKLEHKLAGWKNKLLSRAGRLTLVSSVLSSIPIFFMSVFRLPSWVIKAIDKLRRGFLWGNLSSNNRGLHLLAWDRVCLPKEFGGFGVVNLKLLNISLLLRWLWRISHNPSSQWALIAKTLIASRNQQIPLNWSTHGSFFWKDLLQLRHIFSLSTTTLIADGRSTLFWYANWGNGHLQYFDSVPKPIMPKLTVHSVLSSPETVLQAPWSRQIHDAVNSVSLLHRTTGCDKIVWKWESSGCFTVRSAYGMLISAGKIKFRASLIWKLKLPPSIKIFTLLLFHDRILTQEALLKRNILVQQGCVLCNTPVLESATHLFCTCSYVLHVWAKLQQLFPSRMPTTFPDLESLWQHALFNNSGDRTNAKAVLAITTIWAVWLERNNRLFRQEARSVDSLMRWIISQHDLFRKHCQG